MTLHLLLPFSTKNDVADFVKSALDGTIDVNTATDCLHTRKVDTHFTPLQCAVQQSNFNSKLGTKFNARTVMELIKKGADVNTSNEASKVTPLHLAVKYADFVTVKILLNNGANIDARDNMNRNCLVNATERGNPAICKLLVEEGLDPKERQETFYLDGGNKRNGTSVNMAEKMLIGDENQLTSWRILGAPSLVDYLTLFSFYLDSGVEIASQQLKKVGMVLQGSGQKTFAFNGDMSYKTALAKRTVGNLFPLREKAETKPNSRGCNASMQRVAPYFATSPPRQIDLSNGSKKGAAHGPRSGPIILNTSLNGTNVIMFVTNTSNVSHIPTKLATYLGLKTTTVAGSFHVNGTRVQKKEVKLLQENIECKIVGSNIAFQLKADRCIVSDFDRLQVCVEALPIGNLKVKMGDGTNKGPKNSPLAVVQTGRAGAPESSTTIATINDKKNAVKETFKVGVGLEDEGEEVEVRALNDGQELRITLEGDSEDVCGYCAVRFPGMLKCPLSTTRYCSVACQKLDWPTHKKTLEKAKK